MWCEQQSNDGSEAGDSSGDGGYTLQTPVTMGDKPNTNDTNTQQPQLPSKNCQQQQQDAVPPGNNGTATNKPGVMTSNNNKPDLGDNHNRPLGRQPTHHGGVVHPTLGPLQPINPNMVITGNPNYQENAQLGQENATIAAPMSANLGAEESERSTPQPFLLG